MKKKQIALPVLDEARTPEQQAERDLRDDMDRLNGTIPIGRLSYITMKRPSGGTVYLSGTLTCSRITTIGPTSWASTPPTNWS